MTGIQGRNRAPGKTRQPLLPALIASGACGFAATSAHALQLGDIEVQSALGQPLRASIAYALRPGEELLGSCIFLKPAMGFAALDRATVFLEGGRIHIRGSAPVKEPITAIGLSVDCYYTANLTREYLLMLDPVPLQPPAGAQIRLAGRGQSSAAISASAEALTNRPAPLNQKQDVSAIGPSTRYEVQPGDSLSDIASRIENRKIALWPAVEQIFAANSDAFVDGDMNKLKAGSVLVIPAFIDGGPQQATASWTANTFAATAASDNVQPPVVYDQPRLDSVADAEPSTAAANERFSRPTDQARPGSIESIGAFASNVVDTPTEASDDVGSEISEPAATGVATSAPDQTADLEPGDVFVNDDGLNENTQPGATANAAGAESGSVFRWILFFGGAGVLVGAALFLYGRRSRWTHSPSPQSLATEEQIPDDAPTTQNRILSVVDFDVSEPDEGESAGNLDADLSEGTGLTQVQLAAVALNAEPGDDRAQSNDSRSDDLEYVDAAAITIEEELPPIIIPNEPIEAKTILESEVMPSDEDNDDEYDVSMVMDATKHRFSDNDVTAKQLEAVAVENVSAIDDDEYTLSNALDYDILEQDYQEELSATQILNKEIMEAAEELKTRLADEDSDSDEDTQSTPALSEDDGSIDISFDDDLAASMESSPVLDADSYIEDTAKNVELADADAQTGQQTAVLPADALVSDDDETALVPSGALELETGSSDSDQTSEMPVAKNDSGALEDTSATTELTAEATAQLPGAENDETAEMSIESGEYRTPKQAG